jgi:hypothetical protein
VKKASLLVAAAATMLLTTALPRDAAAVAITPHTPADTFTVSNQDDGRSITAHVGDRIVVSLDGTSGDGVRWAWSAPAADSPDVLNTSSAGTTPSGDAHANFTVAEPGHSAITSYYKCAVTAPGHVCPHIVRSWKVTVAVN